MKHTQSYILIILFASFLVFTACSKKDRDPILIVSVKDVSGTPLEGATVRAWPTDQLEIDSTSSGVVDSIMDQKGITDALGEITFNFPASAVLDLDVAYSLATDTTPVLLEGHKVVKIEVIRQKDEENVFNETVYLE
ncbi:MAG: hypothetical protein P8Q14_08195 [Vicingaceae bacterium]|nr:hypothetical protein [Vicingaceae bacterium]